MQENHNWNIENKNVVITGSTSGIGLSTAIELVKRKANVIIHGSNPEKGTRALQKLKSIASTNDVFFFKADFSSFEEVLELKDKIKNVYPQVDVLINNAGSYFPKRIMTENGLEMTMQVNYFSPFLLTMSLLDQEVITPRKHSRIIIVSSIGHKWAKLDLNDLMMQKRRYNGFLQYFNSKLADILFTYELAEQLKNTPITVNTLHPGIIKSDFLRHNKILSALSLIAHPFMASPDKGAQTSIYLATAPELKNITGKYFVKKRPVSSSKASYNIGLRKKLWEKTLMILKDTKTKIRLFAK